MILSASYKTDIPAFYAPWFLARIRTGSCQQKNPYNGKIYRIPLNSGDIDGIVLWTRNIQPLLAGLDEIRAIAPSSVQFSNTGYPRALESSVISSELAIAGLRQLAARFGPHVAVWRYDPILIYSLTPLLWHRTNFARLATALAGVTNEVVVSFAHIYRKTQRNLDHADKCHDFRWHDPEADRKRALICNFRDIAEANGMRLTICAQKDYLVPGTVLARCIDATPP